MVEGHPVECGKIETELFHLFVPAGNCGDEYRENKFREKYWGETMGKTILTAKHITKLFPGMKALDDVDFDLQQNVFWAHINRKKGRSGWTARWLSLTGPRRLLPGEL